MQTGTRYDNLPIPWGRSVGSCVCFALISLFCAVCVHGLFCAAYAPQVETLLRGLPGLKLPGVQPGVLMLCAALPPAGYCLCMVAVSLRRHLEVAWGCGVAALGGSWGVQAGIAQSMWRCGYALQALWTIVLPLVIFVPFGAYLALLAAQEKHGGTAKREKQQDALSKLLIPGVIYLVLKTITATLTSLYWIKWS